MSTWNALFDYLMNVVTLKNVIIFAVLYFFVIWLSIIAWVIKDVINRTNSILLQMFSVLCVLIFTPFWVFLYLLVRPSTTLFEKYYLEVENNLECLWDDIVWKIWEKNFSIINCNKCSKDIKEDFKYCPYCKSKNKKKEENKYKKKSEK